MIFGLRNQQACDQRADNGRKARGSGRKAGADHDQQSGREKQLGAFGARSLGKEAGQGDPSKDEQGSDDYSAIKQSVDQAVPTVICGMRSQRAEDEDNRHDHDVFEQ